MDKKINLIPQELTVSSSVTKFSKTISKISFVLQILLLLIVIILILFFIYFHITLKKINSSVSNLKNQVISFERTEQQLTLTKDKLSKIVYINTFQTAEKYMTEYINIKDKLNMLPNLTLKEVQIDKDSLIISVAGNDIISILELLKSLKNNENFKNIDLTNLNFSSQKGFLIDIKYYGL